jgi:hypothetical protein
LYRNHSQSYSGIQDATTPKQLAYEIIPSEGSLQQKHRQKESPAHGRASNLGSFPAHHDILSCILGVIEPPLLGVPSSPHPCEMLITLVPGKQHGKCSKFMDCYRAKAFINTPRPFHRSIAE